MKKLAIIAVLLHILCTVSIHAKEIQWNSEALEQETSKQFVDVAESKTVLQKGEKRLVKKIIFT